MIATNSSSKFVSHASNINAIQEKILLGLALFSVILDILINVFDYIGVQTSAFAILKGVIITFVLFNLRNKSSYYFFLFLICILFLRWLSIAVHGHEIDFFFDLIYFLRISYFVIWLLLFNELKNRNKFIDRFLILFISVSSINFACEFIGYVFQLDFFKAYGDQRAGYKGMFFGENDTSIFNVLAFLYSMVLLKERKSYLYPLFALISLVVLGLGSKAALLGVFVVPIFYRYFTVQKKHARNFGKLVLRRVKTISLLLFVILIGYICYVYIGIEDIFVKINYTQFITVLNNADLVTAILSGRNYKVAAYFDSIQSVFDILFGLQIKDMPDYMVEIDLFDYLTRIGLIGIVLVLYLILTVSGLAKNNKITGESKALLALILLFGATAGHVLISTMNGIWIAFFMVFFTRYQYVRSYKNTFAV